MSEDPLCQFDGCTQEAIVESEVRTTDQTYSKAFCEKHKQDGTNAFTNEVASQGKPPFAWDTRLTGKGKREQAEREKKEREEWEQRSREYDRERLYKYGQQDYVSSLIGMVVHGVEHTHFTHIDKENARERHQSGWNDALQRSETQGKAVFLLNTLTEMMEAGDEWYGSDFDKPMTIVEKVIELIRTGWKQ